VLWEILRALDGADLERDNLTVREPSIDDVFLALTGDHVAPDGAGLRSAAASDPEGASR
jgi:hypothetical protein